MKITTQKIAPLTACAALLLVACSKQSPVVTTAQAQLINGAGSSFDNPAFMMWKEAYSKNDSKVQINYQSVGSGAGIKQLLSQTVDFGASDAPMADDAMAKAPGKILHIPVVAGAVAITYNVPGNPKLKFDDAILAGIYLGEITKWNDPKIAALNPDAKLPDTSIIVVHRSDGSGTTFIFTDYLSVVSPDWKSKVGKATSVNWPAGVGGKGSEGVSGQVKQLPGAIGYVELAYAVQNKLPVAELKNAAGKFVAPSPDSVSKAMATATIPDDFRFSMVNAPGDDSYPISGASWVLLYGKQADATKGKALVAFLKWCVSEGQKTSPQLDYAPLPDSVQQRELKLLDTVTY
ncbi:MAG TPA: phosphate ABC transporter substrate-binding protein PstS [Verrucomicrobiae bacterium]|jgi:phosphate transport system substrate-binding protein|nr:phosphate ABC transporter substrate-binding protein PstS [Verrucomicrobiae bacterium]